VKYNFVMMYFFITVAYKLVSKGYYPKVAYFLELYNFNGYFQMKTSLFEESKGN
jgi:hypothetical protein